MSADLSMQIYGIRQYEQMVWSVWSAVSLSFFFYLSVQETFGTLDVSNTTAQVLPPSKGTWNLLAKQTCETARLLQHRSKQRLLCERRKRLNFAFLADSHSEPLNSFNKASEEVDQQKKNSSETAGRGKMPKSQVSTSSSIFLCSWGTILDVFRCQVSMPGRENHDPQVTCRPDDRSALWHVLQVLEVHDSRLQKTGWFSSSVAIARPQPELRLYVFRAGTCILYYI